MSDRPTRAYSSKDVKVSKTIKDFNASPLQSSKSLPKVNKKISKKISVLEIGDNYITDKLKMAEDTLNRMEKSKVLWGELIRFFDKMHTGLKLIAASSASTDETILSLSKLHHGEIGDTLTDLAQTRAKISQQYQICAMTIFNSFVLDVAHSMEPHLKVLEAKTKEVYKDGIALKNQMGAAEKMMYKQQKSNTSQILLQEQIKKFNAVKQENDKGKAQILSSVLLFEKERLSFLVSALGKVATQEVGLGQKFVSQKERLESWKNFAAIKTLTGAQAEAIATTRQVKSIEEIRRTRLKAQQEKERPQRASVFGGNFQSTKDRNQNRETLTLGTNRRTVKLDHDDLNQIENEPEVIATCEEILQDMKAIALILEDSLLNLDGRISHDFIDEINNILAMDELKKAENLIWEYEDYTSDYPAVFHGKKYFKKKQFFKRSFENMKEKLNQLLEEELQYMQNEFAVEASNYVMEDTY